MLNQEFFRDVEAVIGIDADQVGIEGRVVDLGERDAVGHDRLSVTGVAVGNDVRRIQESCLGEP